jgi:phosphatidylserine synthase
MKMLGNTKINSWEQPEEKEFSYKGSMILKRLRALRRHDMLTLLGLLCVSFSMYVSFKGLLSIAYLLILMQLLFDYFDGKVVRAIGGDVIGVSLDSFSDFMAVASSVVFGWFVGINGVAMLIAGFLNVGAASLRMLHFTTSKQKSRIGIPTMLAASCVSTIAFLGYLFVQAYLIWFVIIYFVSAIAIISDLKRKNIITKNYD